MIWERGTVLATAMTPVIVALVSEALKKPAQAVSAVAPKVTTRRSGTGAAVRRFDPDAAETRHHERVGARGEGPERFEPLPPARRGEEPPTRSDDPFGLRAADKPQRHHWKIAVITGLLAFVIAAGFVTVTELRAGGSVSSNRRTSLWGGHEVVDPDPHGDADGHRDAGRGRDPDADADGHRDARGRRRRPPPTPTAAATPRRRLPRCAAAAPRRRPNLLRQMAKDRIPPRGWPARRASPASRPGRRRVSSGRGRPTSPARRRAGRRRSSAATSRPPSRSSPRWGR